MAFKNFHLFVGISTIDAGEHIAGVAERDSLCVRTALTGNLIAFSIFPDFVHFDSSVNEKHSRSEVGVIACMWH